MKLFQILSMSWLRVFQFYFVVWVQIMRDCQSEYTNYMDIQKTCNLYATSDEDHIISDTFLLDGHFTDLYLYPSELKLLQRGKVQTIPIDFNLTFAIISSSEGPIGIELNIDKEKIQLLRDFWPRGNQWESILLTCMKRRDFHEFFKPTKKIGKGNFATVYLAEDLRKNRLVAIKAFMKEAAYRGDGRRGIENEIKLMRMINSQHIVKLHGVYETKNSLYLSMEYLEGNTLELYLRKNKTPSLEQRRKILKALLTALLDLKKMKIAHRDIKPQNIIISSDLESIKLVDLGLATRIDEPSYIFVRCGTPGYIAPEILKIKDLTTVRLGVESDMFSLGAIYYRILYGKSLFGGKEQGEVLQSNRACQIRLQDNQHAGYAEIQLLSSMLQLDPHFRATPEEALKSHFLKEKRLRSSRKVLQSLENAHLPSDWNCLEE